jgi:hypothetical protein
VLKLDPGPNYNTLARGLIGDALNGKNVTVATLGAVFIYMP